MTILKNEHLEDEVLNAIRLKAESIMPKEPRSFFSGQGREEMRRQILIGTSLCF